MSKMPKKPLNLSVAPAAAAADQAGREMVRSPLGIPVPPVPPLAKARHGDDTDDDEQGSPVHAGPYPSSDLPFRPGTSSDNRPPPPTSKPAPPLVPSISLPPPTKPAQGYARSFFMAGPRSQSASRAPPGHVTIRPVTTAEAAAGPGGHNGSIYALREGADSSPDVSSIHPHQTPELIVVRDPPHEDDCYPAGEARMVIGGPPQPSPRREAPPKKARLKPRPFAHLLSRTRSVRTDVPEPTPKSTPKSSGPHRFAEPESAAQKRDAPGLKTAPLHEGDRSFRDMMSSTIRNRSADRQLSAGSENGSIQSQKENHQKAHPTFSSSFKDGTGSVLLSSLKSGSTRAADGIGKAGKGIFGKLGRSGSSTEREPISDENYVCKVINLPLIEQTRRTRISKRLEDSRDKTEFWMPALPWRCIDYLNYKGCEEEGLYRIPGSGYKVKQWQRRFDTELDINLFDEPDLYDINIIGSMFKAWLRELPDEIFPKATQARIADKCAGATEVPQMLKDELSRLPPYNYYLLFAITCHLSLLHSYVDQNKMDYRNLCICFQPCLKMDGFCFHFLVCEWKHCWQGCWTEKEALASENRYLEGEPPSSAGGSTLESREPVEDRVVSSSESSKPPSFSPPQEMVDKAVVTPLPTPTEEEIEFLPAEEYVEQQHHHDDGGDHAQTSSRPKLAPELSPLMPLSPLHM